MNIMDTPIQGCFTLALPRFVDHRGWFLKTFHEESFRLAGLRTDWKEDYVSRSVPGVLRGMHFQSPPSQHAKLVTCLEGRILDVALDLRADSPTYGSAWGVELSPNAIQSLYLPEGLAHGFLALEESVLAYKVTSIHDPERDLGVHWDSFGFHWPQTHPVVSERDAAWPPFPAFETPFRR